jgi:hypothetical protein
MDIPQTVDYFDYKLFIIRYNDIISFYFFSNGTKDGIENLMCHKIKSYHINNIPPDLDKCYKVYLENDY